MTGHRAAVVGCGDVAVVHFAALADSDQAELVAVCDVDPTALAAATKQYGVKGYASVAELLAAEDLDVVHVCTPHDQHAPVAIACLEAGVNVLTEKPLAESLEAADRIIAAEAASSAKLGVCLQNRYNVPIQVARKRLESGELGRIVGGAGTVLWFRAPEYYRAKPWRGTWANSGGGLLMNQAIHTVDLLQWLLGPVENVAGSAHTRALGEAIEVEDTAEMMLTHAGGARSIFYATNAHTINDSVLVEVVTETAVLRIGPELTITHQDGRVETITPAPAEAGGRDYWGTSHEDLIRDFYAGLDNDEPFWITADEARRSLEIIAQVYDQSFPNRVK